MKEITNWYPMYAKDWLTSIKLSLCSLEAKGLLVDLMCLSWENGNPGVITMPAKDVARFLRITEGKMETLLSELERHGRIERDGDLFRNGEIRIPKMVEIGEEQKAKHKKNVENGRKGGLAKAQKSKNSSHSSPPRNTDEPPCIEGLLDVKKEEIPSQPLPLEKSRVEKSRGEEIRKEKEHAPEDAGNFISGSFKHHAKQLLPKLKKPRNLTKSERIRWEKTIAHMLEDSIGTGKPVDAVTNIFNRAMRDDRAKKWLSHPEFFLREYGEFLDAEKPSKISTPPPVFLQVDVMGKVVSQMFKDKKERDAFIEKNNLEAVRGVGDNAVYSARK